MGKTVGSPLGGAFIGLLSLLALAMPSAAQPDGVQRARIRETNAREGWQRVPDILVALNIAPGAKVADVGAGDGFFSPPVRVFHNGHPTDIQHH